MKKIVTILLLMFCLAVSAGQASAGTAAAGRGFYAVYSAALAAGMSETAAATLAYATAAAQSAFEASMAANAAAVYESAAYKQAMQEGRLQDANALVTTAKSHNGDKALEAGKNAAEEAAYKYAKEAGLSDDAARKVAQAAANSAIQYISAYAGKPNSKRSAAEDAEFAAAGASAAILFATISPLGNVAQYFDPPHAKGAQCQGRGSYGAAPGRAGRSAHLPYPAAQPGQHGLDRKEYRHARDHGQRRH